MLKQEDNELITRVGPGTPMGRFMREYWQPAALSSEFPGQDSDPVRVLLLGEKLIGFRDTKGRIGLLDHRCPHRRAPLYYGRNEECGLRCVYHGWKFDVDGNCMEMPNEPPESDFKHKVKAISYPTVERNGIVWAYLGERSTPPPLPSLAANTTEESTVFAFQVPANWLQLLEGDLDTTHASFLHYGGMKVEDQPAGTFSEWQLRTRHASFEVVDTPGGSAYGARRPADPGKEYVRVAQWCFPFYSFPPSGVLGLKLNNICRVPMDDNHTLFVRMYVGGRQGAGADPSRPAMREPASTDWYGRLQTVQGTENDFLIDRDVQRRNEGKDGYTGIPVLQMQDAAVQGAGGPVTDRENERLGAADAMVIRLRRRLISAVKAYTQDGTPPPGVDDPDSYAVRSGGLLVDAGADWFSATNDLRDARVNVPDLDPTLNGPL